MLVRFENERDYSAVFQLNAAAFPSDAEARLVEVLRNLANPVLSLVAEEQGQVIGHIMFTPVSLSTFPEFKIMGLAPMAVAPGSQRKGFGSALVRKGLDFCREQGASAVVVLGHPTYYPQFGFVPSTEFGIFSEYEVPEEVFMAVELEPRALEGKQGLVKYHEAFGAV